MLATFWILLHADAPALNRRRAYRVEVGRDLFGDWRVEISFGRIGAPQGGLLSTRPPMRIRRGSWPGHACSGGFPPRAVSASPMRSSRVSIPPAGC